MASSVVGSPMEPVPEVKWSSTTAKGWSNPTGKLLRPLDDNIWVAERTFFPCTSVAGGGFLSHFARTIV